MSKIEHNKMVDHGIESVEINGRIKTLELNRIKNMFLKDAEVKLRVRNNDKRHPTRIVEGKVIQKNNFLVAIKTKNNIESFNYSDFLIKRAMVI